MDIRVDRFLFEESQELNREYKKLLEMKNDVIDNLRKDNNLLSNNYLVNLESFNQHLKIIDAYIDIILSIDRNAMVYGVKDKISNGLDRYEFLNMKVEVEQTIEENKKGINMMKEYRKHNSFD